MLGDHDARRGRARIRYGDQQVRDGVGTVTRHRNIDVAPNHEDGRRIIDTIDDPGHGVTDIPTDIHRGPGQHFLRMACITRARRGVLDGSLIVTVVRHRNRGNHRVRIVAGKVEYAVADTDKYRGLGIRDIPGLGTGCHVATGIARLEHVVDAAIANRAGQVGFDYRYHRVGTGIPSRDPREVRTRNIAHALHVVSRFTGDYRRGIIDKANHLLAREDIAIRSGRGPRTDDDLFPRATGFAIKFRTTGCSLGGGVNAV